MANSDEFMELLHQVNESVPGSWNPRREQPEYDRMFDGKMEINQNFSNGTDKAHTWLRECAAFSQVIVGGFAGGGDDGLTLADMGLIANERIKDGKNQGLDQ